MSRARSPKTWRAPERGATRGARPSNVPLRSGNTRVEATSHPTRIPDRRHGPVVRPRSVFRERSWSAPCRPSTRAKRTGSREWRKEEAVVRTARARHRGPDAGCRNAASALSRTARAGRAPSSRASARPSTRVKMSVGNLSRRRPLRASNRSCASASEELERGSSCRRQLRLGHPKATPACPRASLFIHCDWSPGGGQDTRALR